MPQGPFGGKQPIGVVYNTSMSRPDAALALAGLYGFEGKRESRIGSVCVVGAGLQTAIFCDMVGRLYTPGPVRNGNQSLPVGLAAVDPLPPDPAMVKPAVERKNDQGEPQYVHSIGKLSDTSLAEAALRNGVIFNAEAVVVLRDRKSTRQNSSHRCISYAVFCLKKKKKARQPSALMRSRSNHSKGRQPSRR